MADLEATAGGARGEGRLFRAGMALSVAALACYVLACAYYALGPTLVGHGESSVVCTAWRFKEGAALYPEAEAAERVAMVYGPMQALWNAGLLRIFGPHVLVVKVAAGLLALAGLACCARTLGRVGDRGAALLGMGWLALAYLKYSMQTFYVRPDTALQVCQSLALLAAVGLPKRWSWVVLGVAVGWGLNLKITMIVYVVPVVVLYWQRQGFGGVWRAGMLAGVLGAAPFLDPRIALGNYLSWLRTSVEEGTEYGRMALPVGGYLALTAVPVACVVGILGWARPRALRALAYRYRWFGVSAAVTAVLVLRVTGKPGAGPAHLLPLFPILGVVLVKSLTELRRGEKVALRGRGWWLAGAGVCVLAALVVLAARSTWVNVMEAGNWKQGWAWVSEVRGLAESYRGRGMAMGVGSSKENYFTARYGVELVLTGNPYLLDVPAMMDMQKAGRAIPEATREMMAEGRCPLWLVPRGEAPFELRNWYEPEGMIFDEEFRRVFRTHYRIVGHSEHFDVWGYE